MPGDEEMILGVSKHGVKVASLDQCVSRKAIEMRYTVLQIEWSLIRLCGVAGSSIQPNSMVMNSVSIYIFDMVLRKADQQFP